MNNNEHVGINNKEAANMKFGNVEEDEDYFYYVRILFFVPCC